MIDFSKEVDDEEIVLACCAGGLSGLAWIAASHTPPVSAQGPGRFPIPTPACDPAVCGKTSPLIPMQSAEAVHMGLVWKRNSTTPKILYHARFPEYVPNDVADPALTDLAISRLALA